MENISVCSENVLCSMVMNGFWEKLSRPYLALAPMEGVTDVVFRHVVAKAARPDVFYTEFTNVSSYVSEKGNHSTRERLAFTEDERPIVAQIWGSRPEHFETTAYGLKEMGYEAIDINMGCPDKNVVRTGGGSDLIRNPRLACEIIEATKRAGLPVSVKTRLGYSKVEEWREWLKLLLEQDIANLTVHLRTKKEMSKVGAHHELTNEIVELRNSTAQETLICINGDVKDRQEAEELAKKYGLDGVMIGRGVFGNPYCFELEPREHSREELLDLLNYHLDEFDKFNSEVGARKFEPLKRFFKIYVREFEGASEMREKLMQAKSTDEVRDLLVLSN